jgi:hypothetical protein
VSSASQSGSVNVGSSGGSSGRSTGRRSSVPSHLSFPFKPDSFFFNFKNFSSFFFSCGSCVSAFSKPLLFLFFFVSHDRVGVIVEDVSQVAFASVHSGRGLKQKK